MSSLSRSCSNVVECLCSAHCRVHRPRVTNPSGIGYARVDAEQTLPADEEPTEIAQPGDAAFDAVVLYGVVNLAVTPQTPKQRSV